MRSIFTVVLSVALASSLVARARSAALVNQPQSFHPWLDVAFILDTTGSMGDEIEVVKQKLVAISQEVRAVRLS